MVEATRADARKQSRVLVVEDDAGISGMVAWLLSDHGFQVAQATDGAQGLELARREAPDVIVTDIRMPVMDGWRFLEECRGLATCAATPVIVISVGVSSAAAQQHAHLHVNAYLAKPFDVDVLLAAVQQLLKTPQAVLEYADSQWRAT